MASLAVAYLLWATLGLFGAHHIYLGRYSHAFLFATTLGGFFGWGWLRDLYRLPVYVRQANAEPLYLEELKTQMKLRPHPPWSLPRLFAQTVFGALLGLVAQAPLGWIEPAATLRSPPDLAAIPLWWQALQAAVAVAGTAAGVILVGRVGGQRTANRAYVLLATVAGMAVDLLFAQQAGLLHFSLWCGLCPAVVWQRSCEWVPACTHSPIPASSAGGSRSSRCARTCCPCCPSAATLRSLTMLFLGTLLFWAFAGTYFYHFGTINVRAVHHVHSDEPFRGPPVIRVKTALTNLLQSPFWRDLRPHLAAAWAAFTDADSGGWTRGWHATRRAMDLDGLDHALDVLGFPTPRYDEASGRPLRSSLPTAAEVRRRRRELILRSHPDKLPVAEHRAGEERMVAIEQAFRVVQTALMAGTEQESEGLDNGPYT